MYDAAKFRIAVNPTWGDLKALMKEMGVSDDTAVVLCGDNHYYVHVEEDGSIVNFDNDDLAEVYEEHGVDLDEFYFGQKTVGKME